MENVVENGVKNVELLPAVSDEYGGIIVEMKEPMNPNVFHSMLISSLEKWKLLGKKGVWIKLPISLVNLVEFVVKDKFACGRFPKTLSYFCSLIVTALNYDRSEIKTDTKGFDRKVVSIQSILGVIKQHTSHILNREIEEQLSSLFRSGQFPLPPATNMEQVVNSLTANSTSLPDLYETAESLLVEPIKIRRRGSENEGFWYHHAEPQYLMLVYWIPETYNTLPINATHRVRIGAIVMNDRKELLVVQEKMGRFHGTGFWKIPTGTLDEGEDIFRGALREVKEETGVDTEFVEILGFRQLHKSFFQKSDLLFLCTLRPLSYDIQKQDSEIDAVRWMPFEEYAAQPVCQKHDLFKHMNDVCLAKLGKCYTGFTPSAIKSYFGDPLSYLYLNKHCLKSQNGVAHL